MLYNLLTRNLKLDLHNTLNPDALGRGVVGGCPSSHFLFIVSRSTVMSGVDIFNLDCRQNIKIFYQNTLIPTYFNKYISLCFVKVGFIHPRIP